MEPAREDPEALMSVASKRKLDGARWSLASPAPDNVRGVPGVLGVRYRQLADGEFNPTSALVPLDREGRIVTRPPQIGSPGDPEFVAELRSLLSPSATNAKSPAHTQALQPPPPTGPCHAPSP